MNAFACIFVKGVQPDRAMVTAGLTAFGQFERKRLPTH